MVEDSFDYLLVSSEQNSDLGKSNTYILSPPMYTVSAITNMTGHYRSSLLILAVSLETLNLKQKGVKVCYNRTQEENFFVEEKSQMNRRVW